MIYHEQYNLHEGDEITHFQRSFVAACPKDMCKIIRFKAETLSHSLVAYHEKGIHKKAIVLCNPPYGERLLDAAEAEKLYQKMGIVLKPMRDHGYYIITPHEDFESLFGRKADKKRKLYNGMLKCQLYMYFR